MVEGARLESVFRGNSNVGSNPTLSAIKISNKNLRSNIHRAIAERAWHDFSLVNPALAMH